MLHLRLWGRLIFRPTRKAPQMNLNLEDRGDIASSVPIPTTRIAPPARQHEACGGFRKRNMRSHSFACIHILPELSKY